MSNFRRALLLIALLGVSGVVVFFLLHRDPDAPKSSWPGLTDAATAVEPVKIKVAPNVHVSVGDVQMRARRSHSDSRLTLLGRVTQACRDRAAVFFRSLRSRGRTRGSG